MSRQTTPGATALWRVVGNKVEAAYKRTDQFEPRRGLMDEWAKYLAARIGNALLTTEAGVPVDVTRRFETILDGADRRMRVPRR